MKIIESRFLLIKSILNILGQNAVCFGDFLRIYFEYKFHNVFEDNHILNFFYINKKQGLFEEDLVKNFNDFIDQFKITQCLSVYKIMNVSCTSDSRHLGYEEKIPMYRLVLNHLDDFIIVNILCWKPKFLGELSINSLEYNTAGFQSSDQKFSVSFILDNIKNKEMYFSKDLSIIQNLAYPSIPIPRIRKIKFLSLLYNNIEKRFMYMPLGYKLRGNIPSLSCEKFEDCPITSCEPPYLNIELECKHKLSLEAYKGILFSKMQFSEAIRCPYCRDNLKINFKTV